MERGELTGLITRYGRLIRSVVARVARRHDADLGDEVEQRVAEALWRQVGSGSEQRIDHPASYIYRCAVRETVRELERELSRSGEALLADGPGAPVAAGDPELDARARQLAEATERCLTGFSPERAHAVRAHLAGFEVEEIMKIHGWPYQKARNLIARGIADLRRQLQEQGFNER